MEALGAEVHTIVEPDPVSGFLGARLNRVKELLESDERFVWLNQYSNSNAWKAHFRTTGPAIARQFPGPRRAVRRGGHDRHPDGLRAVLPAVAPAGAGRRDRQRRFGGVRRPPARRMIPGLGTGVRPEMLDESFVDDVVWVEESDTVRSLPPAGPQGLPLRGSTGTVVSGAATWLGRHDRHGELTAVALAPDLGERYLDTVYQANWVQDLYGYDVLEEQELTGARWCSNR